MLKNKKILCIIDMQNDFLTGTLANSKNEQVLKNTLKVIDSTEFDYIYLTKDLHQKNYLDTLEGKALPIKHCIVSTPGCNIHSDILDKFYNHYEVTVLHKNTFFSHDLYICLTTIMNDSPNVMFDIYFCGVCTDICVISNVLPYVNYANRCKVHVYENACAGLTEESHKSALEVMKNCQIDILKV